MEKTHDIIVGAEASGTRLDIYLSQKIGLSRSQTEKLIRNGLVTLNKTSPKQGYRVKKDDRLFVTVPEPEKISAEPENIPLDIIYEDKDIIVINKPRGIVVHPATGSPSGTLVNALLYHIKDLSGLGGSLRPGVVHRLDKDTSGLLVFAKNQEAQTSLSRQFKERKVKKIYYALAYGLIRQDSGSISAPIGRSPADRKKMAVIKDQNLKSREALTGFRVIRRYPAKSGRGYTLLELELKTGRTHQIRVHLSHIGHPVVGDPAYSRKKDEFGVGGQLLHSKTLGFYHPTTGKYMEFNSELPEDFERVLRGLV